jgi:hypothetical protein
MGTEVGVRSSGMQVTIEVHYVLCISKSYKKELLMFSPQRHNVCLER